MARTVRLLFTALFALTLAPIGWAQRAFPPLDQAAQQPDFFSFRAQLLVAVARHDVEAVLSVLGRDIKNSFGGEGGVKEFRETWQPESPDSRLWPTLAGVLALGGTFSADGRFTAPYVFSAWPNDLDAFEHIAVIGSQVRVRSAPEANAPVVGSLSHGIVALGEVKDAEAAWMPVRLPSGPPGFVDRRYLRSPIDYRAIFEKVEGRWRLTAFLAGD